MDRNRAKELLPVITAFAEGKTIQSNSQLIGWHDAIDLNFNADPSIYRVKPEPKLRPLNAEELNRLVGTVIVLKSAKPRGRCFVIDSGSDCAVVGSIGPVSDGRLLNHYEREDGTPLGVTE